MSFARVSSATSSLPCCCLKEHRCCSAETNWDARRGGNNNAWCQDNQVSWYDWSRDAAALELHEFTKRLIALRHEHPVFRRESFLEGVVAGEELPDVWWFRPDGYKMTQKDWSAGEPVLGAFLNGEAIPDLGPKGEPIRDDSFLLIFNASGEDREFTLPRKTMGSSWTLTLTTAKPELEEGSFSYDAHSQLMVTAHTFVVLKRGK